MTFIPRGVHTNTFQLHTQQLPLVIQSDPKEEHFAEKNTAKKLVKNGGRRGIRTLSGMLAILRLVE